MIFERVTVNLDFQNHKIIRWWVGTGFINKADYSFSIDRSSDPGGGWTTIASGLDACYYVDTSSTGTNPDRDQYYRVCYATHDSESDRLDPIYSTPVLEGDVYTNERDWKVIREIIRKEHLMLERYFGVPGSLLKLRKTGTPCSCVDKYLDSRVIRNCPLCLGTGVLGGYYPPIEMWVNMLEAPSGNAVITPEAGTIDPGIIQNGYTVCFPLLETADVWVNKLNNDRFTLKTVKPKATYKGVVLTVEMEMVKITKKMTDIINSAEVTVILNSDPAPSGTSNGYNPDLVQTNY